MALRICHVVEATSGGVRRHVIDLLWCLVERDAELTVVYSAIRADAVWYRDLAAIGPRVRLIEIPMWPRLAPARDARSIVRLAALFRREKFDVLHVHSGKGGLLARVAAVLAGVPHRVVYTPNASPFRLNPIFATAERALSQVTDTVIAVTRSEYDELLHERVVPEGRLRLTRASGIDVDRFRQFESARAALRRELGVGPEQVLIGLVGRLAPQKNPLLFVEAAALVSERVPDARFMWLGDGELRPDFKRPSRQPGSSRIPYFPEYVRR